MKNRKGNLLMTLGLVLILAALALVGYNQWDASRAQQESDDALMALAHMAVERKTGARGLRSIMESLMMDTMYEIPSDSTIGICTITKDVVEGKSAPELVYRDNTVPRKSFTGRSKKDRTGEIA